MGLFVLTIGYYRLEYNRLPICEIMVACFYFDMVGTFQEASKFKSRRESIIEYLLRRKVVIFESTFSQALQSA